MVGMQTSTLASPRASISTREQNKEAHGDLLTFCVRFQSYRFAALLG